MSVLTTTPLKVAPPAAVGVTVTTGTMPTWGAWVEVIAATAAPIAIAGVTVAAGTFATDDGEVDIGVGAAAAEVSVGTLRLYGHNAAATGAPVSGLLPVPLGGIGSGVRVAVRTRSGLTTFTTIALLYYENFTSDQVTTSSQVLTSAPSGSASSTITPSATPWADSAWVQLLASAATDIGLLGLVHGVLAAGAEDGIEYDLGTGGSGAETVITTLREAPASGRLPYIWLPGIYPVAAGTRVAVRMRKAGTTTTAHSVALLYYTNVSAPSSGITVSGATVASTATLFAGSAATTTALTGAAIASAATLTPGSVTVSAPTRLSQLLVEVLDVIPHSPLAATQVAAEILFANANDTRVTQIVYELIIIPRTVLFICPPDFPIDPD